MSTIRLKILAALLAFGAGAAACVVIALLAGQVL